MMPLEKRRALVAGRGHQSGRDDALDGAFCRARRFTYGSFADFDFDLLVAIWPSSGVNDSIMCCH